VSTVRDNTDTDSHQNVNVNTEFDPHAKFQFYPLDHSNPNARAVGNVKFVAPPGSKLHIDTNSGYHSLAYRDNDGTNRVRSDYGHLFTITGPDGDIIANGVLNGLNFNSVSISVSPAFPDTTAAPVKSKQPTSD
jgi:hypothetical protein